MWNASGRCRWIIRRYRLTASRFGEVFHRKVDTRPDALVLRLIQQKQFFSHAVEWGIKQEPTAIAAYSYTVST